MTFTAFAETIAGVDGFEVVAMFSKEDKPPEEKAILSALVIKQVNNPAVHKTTAKRFLRFFFMFSLIDSFLVD